MLAARKLRTRGISQRPKRLMLEGGRDAHLLGSCLRECLLESCFRECLLESWLRES